MSVKSGGSAASNNSAPAAVQERRLSPAQWDRLVGLLLFAVTLALYLRTLARDLLPGDPGEFQFAAWRFGVAHATGYPLYLLLGGLWQRLWGFVGVNPAAALNAFSAVAAATAVALFYATLRPWLPGTPNLRRAGALVGAAFLATNPTFWSQALIAEVYALHALLLVLILDALRRIEQAEAGQAGPARLLLLVGLSLAHHATTLLLLPGLAVALWLLRHKLARGAGAWLPAVGLLLLPLLLYLYVPLRATPAASPWLFPTLGSETLALYTGGWQGFRDFVTGRTISVGYYGVGEALAGLRQAGTLWRLHLGWPGLALLLIGLFVLVRERRWALLAFTGLSAFALQTFNLFYAIEDILVYYVPLYVLAALWVGFGAWQLGSGFMQMAADINAEPSSAAPVAASVSVPASAPASARGTSRPIDWELFGVALTLLLLYMPMRQSIDYGPRLDQSNADAARRTWEGILAAEPPQGALLVSNDRNEIVPLYYLQQVEQRRRDLTGIFPLIAPDPRFGDVGATVDTALASGAPVALIKPMPGLEVRFALDSSSPPLVRVLGAAGQEPPLLEIDQPYGPLALRGLDWLPEETAAQGAGGRAVTVRLHWAVREPLPGLYTTTVQAFDADGAKLAQNDAAAGGVFYPTTLWKPGERIVETHLLLLPEGAAAVTLLVGLYTGSDLAPLEQPLLIDLAAYGIAQ